MDAPLPPKLINSLFPKGNYLGNSEILRSFSKQLYNKSKQVFIKAKK